MSIVLTNLGKGFLSYAVQKPPEWNAFDYRSRCGTGATPTIAAANTDVATATQSIAAVTTSRVTTTTTNDTFRLTSTFTCAATGKTVTNVGVFEVEEEVGLILHADIASGAGIALNVGDSIDFVFDMVF